MNSHIKYFTDHLDSKFPYTYVDIGAMGGIPKKWDCLRPNMKVIAFEPDEREFSKLKNSDRTRYFNYALFRDAQPLKYYVTKGHGKSSVYLPNDTVVKEFEDVERFRIVKEETLPKERVKSLDDVVSENKIASIDFIKLDTQGSELNILEGARDRVLPQTFGLNIEVEFTQIYQGQPLFCDVDRFLRAQGFELIDLRRAYWKRKDYYDYVGKGQLVFGDALYFKRLDVLSKDFSAASDKMFAVSKIYKGIVTCLVYRIFDYAVSLAKMGFTLNLLSEDECATAIGVIMDSSKKGVLPFFPGRTFLYKVLNRMSQALRPKSYLGWADGDRMIGNIKDV